jgi:hypothetical protein
MKSSKKQKLRSYNPRCQADWKDEKCHPIVRVYKKINIDIEEIDNNSITVRKGYDAIFVEEVKARIIEWFQGDFRIAVYFEPEGRENTVTKEVYIDMYIPDDITHKIRGDYIYVLRFEVEEGFKSKCK